MSAAVVAAGRALAALDVAAALAELAASAQLRAAGAARASTAFAIEGGRHPVVEAALLRQGGSGFVPNDCELGPERRLWLLTGPNMAGKSTFLRQNALIAVMAQAGSFVPAKQATHRHRRPPVQPRRRGRRSGARPLDLHGRDGRDRGDPQPGDGAEAW